MKRLFLFIALLMFSLTLHSVAHAQAGPQEMDISCSKPKPAAQRGLERPRGDGNTWTFRINPAPSVHWAEGPNWSYPGKGGADPDWGQWSGGDGQMWLGWISPNKSGAFNIKVTGKISCGNGGPGELIDIEANWFGDVVSKNWQANPDIKGGEMILPQDQSVDPAEPATVVVGVGSKVRCELLSATDRDTWNYGSQSGQEDDSVTYKWTASGGGFYPSGTATEATTRIAYWKAPTATGTYTLQCVVDDEGDVQSPDSGTRDDDAITRTVQVEVADGHWVHSSWNTNDAKVQWSHTSNGDLDPVVNPKYATETLSWVPAAGGAAKPDKQVHVPFERTVFDRGFDETKCQYAATAKFVAHSAISGGPDSDEIEGVAILTPSTNSAAANVQLSCPPSSVDISSFSMSQTVALAANLTIICVDPPAHFMCETGQFQRGMQTMGTGHAMDNPAASWSTGYDSYLTIDGNDVTLHNPDGTTQTYTWNGTGYDSPAGDYSVLTKTGTNTYVITQQDGSSQTFDIPSGSSYTNPMLSQMEDQFGNTTTLDRDSDGKLTKITDPTGLETTLSYDSNGRLTGATDPYGETSSITYDSNGRIASVTGIDGRTISYGYDSNGVVTSVTTPEGTWTYDREIGDGSGDLGYDRRLTVTDPNGGKTEYYYDADNMRTYRVDPDDYTSNNGDEDVPKTYYNISRDPNDKAVMEGNQDSNGNISHIERDPNTGLPIKVTDALGNESTFTYNAQGQVTSTTDAAGKTTTYTYDTNGIDLLSITDSDNNTVSTFTYGSNHEVLTATDVDNNTTTYTYTSWGDVATSTDANGKVTTYNYNSTDHLLTSTSVDGSTVASYTYDSHQRVRTATGADGITQTYDYNDANQVTKITYPDSTTE